jgi:lysyl-tRNA synthetase class 2
MKESMQQIKAPFLLHQAIRDFFRSQDFLETLTPPMVENPGMEVHIHPFAVSHTGASVMTGKYLHTSPEFHMKELLSKGLEKIFTLSYCFRDEPDSETHRPQFVMLEWYRAHEHYTQIMRDTEALITHCAEVLNRNGVPVKTPYLSLTPTRMTMRECFLEMLGADLFDLLEVKNLRRYIEKDHTDVPMPSIPLPWDDLFFLLFLNKVEPQFRSIPFLLLSEFPAQMAALSTLKKDDPRVCERFEVYLNGLELCNAYNELTDIKEQKLRFERQAKEKNELYGYTLPEAKILFNALERGLPPSSGIAMGVDRLLMGLTGDSNPFWN